MALLSANSIPIGQAVSQFIDQPTGLLDRKIFGNISVEPLVREFLRIQSLVPGHGEDSAKLVLGGSAMRLALGWPFSCGRLWPITLGTVNPDYAHPSDLILAGGIQLSQFSQFQIDIHSAQNSPYPKVTFSVSF